MACSSASTAAENPGAIADRSGAAASCEAAVRICANHGLRRGALVARQLAADQIVGLNAGGSLVNRRDAGIAKKLRGARLLDEAHAAVHLNPERGDVHRILRAPALMTGIIRSAMA